jgi:hypothetical protein
MMIEEIEDVGAKKMQLSSFDPNNPEITTLNFICIAGDNHKEWFQTITTQLDSLRNIQNELENPLGYMNSSARKSY